MIIYDEFGIPETIEAGFKSVADYTRLNKGGKEIDIRKRSAFYITQTGEKSIIPKAGQKLSCKWDDKLLNDNGWRVRTSSDDVIDAKRAALNEIKKFAAKTRNLITNHADAVEVAGWADKAGVAQRVIDGVATEAEIASIGIEANKRGYGETAKQLAAKQLGKAAQFRTARAWIDGLQSQAEAVLENTEVNNLEATVQQLLVAGEAELKKLLQGAN